MRKRLLAGLALGLALALVPVAVTSLTGLRAGAESPAERVGPLQLLEALNARMGQLQLTEMTAAEIANAVVAEASALGISDYGMMAAALEAPLFLPRMSADVRDRVREAANLLRSEARRSLAPTAPVQPMAAELPTPPAPPPAMPPAPPPAAMPQTAGEAPTPPPADNPVVPTNTDPLPPAPGTRVPVTGLDPAEVAERPAAYNRPTEMQLGKPVDISLVIDATGAGNPAAGLEGFPGEIVEAPIPTTDRVVATLSGVNFDISAQTLDRQTLSPFEANRWQWRVTPTSEGPQTLILEVFAIPAATGEALPVRTYRDQITVSVEDTEKVFTLARTWQPVVALLAALVSLIVGGVGLYGMVTKRRAAKAAEAERKDPPLPDVPGA
jgi:hypothetical protein